MGLHLQYIFSRMSYLIDQFNALFSTANYNSIGKQSGIQIEDLQMARLNKDLEKRGQSIGQDKIINYEMHTDGQRTFILILRSLKIDRLNFIQKITYNKKVKNWRMELNIFTDGQRFLKISKPAKVIQFIKAVSKLFKPFNFQFVKCMVNVKNGLIIFRFTDYLSINNKVREILKISQMRMDIFLQQLIKNHNIVQLLLDISSKMQNFKQGSQIPSKFIAYGKKIGIFLELGDQRVENSMLLNESKQLQTKNQTLSSFTQISEEELRLFKLYSPYENRADLSLRQRDLQWQSKHKSEIANKIKMPGISNCINRLENNYIFNFIKISNSDSLDLRPLSHGGFAKVFSAFIQYWYVYSNSNGQLVPISDDTKFSNDKLLRKIMIVKRQSQPQNRPARRRNRVQHEIKILKQIKNSKALFVPKYYVSAEENCLGSDLLSDQLFMPNIMEYFNFHRWSTSLFTKMYILFMIVQGARYLKQSNIVHLDLKPNNIMISKSLMIKIIDYGESYHPNVCKNNHLPGLTMPYSSPQNYTSQKQFTQKSDVFSIGVMAYQIFYQRFPFFLYSEKSKAEVFLFNQYPDYWFYNHEQLQCHGDRLIFPFFQFVIGKCLDPDPNRRPQLDWLCAVIRQSFDFYA